MRWAWLAIAGAVWIQVLACAAGDPATRPLGSASPSAFHTATDPDPLDSAPGTLLGWCRAKYGADPAALSACAPEELAAFERLLPSLDLAATDPQATEARIMESCRRLHEGPHGIDWMMVEHCFARRTTAAGLGTPGR